jgi:hypothetical protein
MTTLTDVEDRVGVCEYAEPRLWTRPAAAMPDNSLATPRGILIGLVLSGAIWIGVVAVFVF